ncbi:mitochondrial import inner membrane translocase subunit Tim54 [Phyllosticta citrichinensis]|uniref:Mitochondrial import inner membrane translocase subunit TIM54 n=1 Tax=Phyllosticta citrichinensis TaxID=1130410 RepID=A0ABR1XUQ8_9PEZI
MSDAPRPDAASASSAAEGAAKSAAQNAAKASEGNPVFRMMGLPNFKFKLPSRNWMIFLTITGTWTAALVYDRQQKKRVQQKWCDAVAHLAREPLPTDTMPRRMTIYLSAPPGDGLMSAREHFHEYVKPILVAAAMDWDAVEGRREGDVRAGLAERVRRWRKLRGEATSEPLPEDVESITQHARDRVGIKEWDGVGGSVVIGRNTWKEYIRGLHEGWLGPLDKPPEPEPVQEAPLATTPSDDASPSAAPVATDDQQKPPAEGEQEQKKEEEEEKEKPKKKTQPPPFIPTSAYPSAMLAPSTPSELPPATAVAFPHILGFLNTPIRMYRFLTRRHLADQIGAQVAAAVLATCKPFDGPPEGSSTSTGAVADDEEHAAGWEQARLLRHEEMEWHKSVRKDAEAKRAQGQESVWCDEMVLDARVAGRMRKFVLSEEEKARVARIAEGKEGKESVLGEPSEKEL